MKFLPLGLFLFTLWTTPVTAGVFDPPTKQEIAHMTAASVVDDCVVLMHTIGLMEQEKGRPYFSFSAYFNPVDERVYWSGTTVQVSAEFNACVDKKWAEITRAPHAPGARP